MVLTQGPSSGIQVAQLLDPYYYPNLALIIPLRLLALKCAGLRLRDELTPCGGSGYKRADGNVPPGTV